MQNSHISLPSLDENYHEWLNKIPLEFSYFTEEDYNTFNVYPIEKQDAFKMLFKIDTSKILNLLKIAKATDNLCLKEFLSLYISKHYLSFYFKDLTESNSIKSGVGSADVEDVDILKVLKYLNTDSKTPEIGILTNGIVGLKIDKFDIFRILKYSENKNPELLKVYPERFSTIYEILKEDFERRRQEQFDPLEQSHRIFSHKHVINENIELKFWLVEQLNKFITDDGIDKTKFSESALPESMLSDLISNENLSQQLKKKNLISEMPDVRTEFDGFIETRPSKLIMKIIEFLGKDELLEVYHKDTKHRDFIKDDCVYREQSDKFNCMKFINFFFSIDIIAENTFMNVFGIEEFEIPDGTTWVRNLRLNKHMATNGIMTVPDSIICFEMYEEPTFKILCRNKNKFKRALILGGCECVDKVLSHTYIHKGLFSYGTEQFRLNNICGARYNM